MARWKLVLEYDGAGFHGWGLQPETRTVQGAVEEGLASFLGEPVRVEASGRTDAGVHALGQVIAFSTDVPRAPLAMRDGLNHHLPDDVACVDAELVADDFDPRRTARSKLYRYAWLTRRTRSPLRRDRVWHIRHDLDVDAMNEAVQALAGTHDFQSFRAARCQAATSVRTIPHWEVLRVGDEVHLFATGHGFLQHMIRIVAGSLTEVGRGRRPVGWIGEVLHARDRSCAGRTAPASGLTLMSVTYGPDGR